LQPELLLVPSLFPLLHLLNFSLLRGNDFSQLLISGRFDLLRASFAMTIATFVMRNHGVKPQIELVICCA